MHQSTKLFSGFSCCFRQWRATHSHCQFLHGYALSFRVTFSGELDTRNWVCDFGCFSKNGIKSRLAYLFDHTTLIAADDPQRSSFQKLEEQGLIQLRIVEAVGAERFAQLVCMEINALLLKDEAHAGRVHATRVECMENDKNSAIFSMGASPER